MKGKAFIPLVLGLVVGLFAVKLVIDTVRKSQAQQPTTMITVVRTTADIRAFTRISAEDIEEVEVVDNSLAPADQRIEKKDDNIIGRVAAKAIPMGVPVLQSMLSPKGTHPGIIARIRPGYRAVAVKIDEASTAGFQIQPGDYVDVIVVMDVRNGAGKKETIAEVLLQQVEVGAIGQGLTGQTDGKSGGKIKPAKTATLLVREEDSPKLHLAATRGKITLSLRGAHDQTPGSMASASTSNMLASLLEWDQAPAPVQQPQATLTAARPTQPQAQPFNVLIRRGSGMGDTLETITFESKDSSNIIGVTRGTATPRASLAGAARLLRPSRQLRVPPGPFPPNPNVDPDEDQDYVDPGE